MASKPIYEVPRAGIIDGINLKRDSFKAVFDSRLDATRLMRGEDILVATYPKTGTTWLTQIVTLLLAGEDNYEETKKTPLFERALFLENTKPGSDVAEITKRPTLKAPRVCKTHLPYRFINRWIEEDNVKTIICTRNPKDTLVSFFNHYKSLKGYDFTGSWEDFFEHVKAGKVLYGDQCSWMQDWYKNRNKGDLLFLKYEEMQQDIVSAIRKIAQFLDIALSDELLQRIVGDVHISSMKKDPATAIIPHTLAGKDFIKDGKCGKWKQTFTVAQNEWHDEKYQKQYKDLDEVIVYY